MGVGLGAVLAQKQDDGPTHPIAYASRTLQAHEQNYGVTELEALAVVWAVKHFNRTLIDMLAKKVGQSGLDWDDHLPYVLFAY